MTKLAHCTIRQRALGVWLTAMLLACNSAAPSGTILPVKGDTSGTGSTPTYIVGDYNARSVIVSGTRVSWQLFIPANYNPAVAKPLVLAWSGSGSHGTDNTTQLLDGLPTVITAQKATFPAFAALLQTNTGPLFNSINDTMLPLVVAAVQAEFNIDAHRISMTGLSEGGWFCYENLYNNPTLFSAILIGSSAVNNFRISGNTLLTPTITVTPNNVSTAAAKIAAVNTTMPIWHWEDSNDLSANATTQDARDTKTAFQAVNSRYTYTEASRGGHVATYRAMYADTTAVKDGVKGAIAWLLAQRKP